LQVLTDSGASALAGYGLPTDAALAAHAAINQRAKVYKKAKINPDARIPGWTNCACSRTATSSTASPPARHAGWCRQGGSG
jgi:hypothetical protein